MAKHFSHNHKLHQFEVQQANEEDYEAEIINCSACEAKLTGLAYKCNENNCEFYLHKQCFELPREINHKSHPEHALCLYAVPPNTFESFLCKACSMSSSAFVYHCPNPGCDYDLHVKCSHLPETIESRGHCHTLSLVFSVQKDLENHEELRCGACGSDFPDWLWSYFCKECNYGEHLGFEFVV